MPDPARLRPYRKFGREGVDQATFQDSGRTRRHNPKTDEFANDSPRQWLAFTPCKLVRAYLKIDRSRLARIATPETVVPG